jgi:uncharacterized protein (TIGR02302 family)
MSETLPKSLSARIFWQRLLLAGAGLWAALQPLLVTVALVIAALAFNVSQFFPPLFNLILLGLGLLAILWSLRGLVKFRWPSVADAVRQLERANSLPHREVSGLQDELVSEQNNAEGSELWQAHQLRLLARLPVLNLAVPKSSWREFDPVALRVPVALALVTSLLLGRGDVLPNFRNVASFSGPIAASPMVLDAWLKPPTYTKKPPVLLTSKAMMDKLERDPEILTPENSILNIRLAGVAKPQVKLFAMNGEGAAAEPIEENRYPLVKSGDGVITNVTLDRPMVVKVSDGDKNLSTFTLAVVPDHPPTIDFAADPTGDERGALNVQWKATDDYGVKSVSAEISLADQQEDAIGFADNGVFLYDPPKFNVPMKHPGAASVSENTAQDLSSHAWAGLYVEMVLTAEDAAGHKGSSAPKRFKLPERAFFKPLAQALIEQRKKLILNPDTAPDVATMMQALLTYPTSLFGKSGLFLNLSAARAALANASAPDDVVEQVGNLWPLIVAVEDGEAADARAELRDLKKQLEQALRDGADQNRIAQLTDRMRKAMDKLMKQLGKEAQKRLAEGGKLPQGKGVSPKDLQKMLDAIEQLSKGGAKDKAEELLSQLDKMLQNLQPGNGQQAEGGNPTQDQLDALSGLMRKQQQLMDETQRMGEGGNEPGDPSTSPGAQGNSGDGSKLGERQGALKDLLDSLQQQMDREAEGNLGDAGKSMGDAQQSLKDGSKGQALQQQGDAMKQLREGAAKLSRKLAEQGQGQTGQQSHDGQASDNEDDPLGRPSATRHPGEGPDKNLIPSELAMQRAREILEELRNRAGDQALSPEDRAYIERLLKGLY